MLRADVTGLPRLYEEYGRALAGNGPQMLRTRTGRTGTAPGLRFNFEASELRSEIRSLLVSWAAMVVDERGVAAPRRDVAALATFLGLHLDWLAAHDTAADVSEEFARLAGRARRPGGAETGPRPVEVGPCPEQGCSGRMVLHGGAVEAGTDIVCDSDAAHHWCSADWTRLARQLAGPGTATRWLSAGDISALWDIATGSVYRYASTDGWRKHTRSGRTYYAEADVERSLAARRRTGAGGRASGGGSEA